jgi:site-specific DNA-methyltransferase (adenine-specific)/modification methylase
MHNFFECPSCRFPEKISFPNHPTQKPLALIEHLIKIASNPNAIVLDPFMGVCTTGEGALNLNRKFIGCDINKEYCEATLRRLSKF